MKTTRRDLLKLGGGAALGALFTPAPWRLITDTALFRYPHYHQPSDTPDKVDNEKLARVVKGIERVIRDLAR